MVYALLIRINDIKLRKQILEIPDKSLKNINDACRRDNDAQLIAWGIESIIKIQADLVFEAVWHSPNKLVKIAKLFGSMSWELCNNIMQEFANHPIVTINFNSLSLLQIYQQLQSIEISHRYNPIPKALRDHFDGKLVLRNTQLERHH